LQQSINALLNSSIGKLLRSRNQRTSNRENQSEAQPMPSEHTTSTRRVLTKANSLAEISSKSIFYNVYA